MKKIISLLMLLSVYVGAAWGQESVDYNPNQEGNRTRGDRMVATVSISSTTFDSKNAANTTTLTHEGYGLKYVDLSATVTMKAAPGETVTPKITLASGKWINGYVYVDKDKDGFTASVGDDGYTPGGDLVSFTYYNGKNSVGTTNNGNHETNLTMPSFTAPTTPGTYRVRFKTDWDNITPDGTGDTNGQNQFESAGGTIIDVTFVIEEVSADEIKATMDALITKAKKAQKGTGLGYFTTDSWNNLQTAISVAEAIVSPTANDVETLQNAIDALVPNKPISGKLYRIKNKANSKYITTPGSAGTRMILGETISYSNVLYFENNHIYSYSSGLPMNWINHAAGTGYVGTYTFEASRNLTPGTLAISMGTNFFKAGENQLEEASPQNSETESCDWIVEEVTWLPIFINESAGYATLYAPVALKNSHDGTQRVAAYAGVVNGNSLSMISVDEDGIIPANTPVIIKYIADRQDSDGCVYLEVVSSDKTVADNDLLGTFKDQTLPAAAYVLAMVDNNVGFYKATGNTPLNNGFKAYLPASAVSTGNAARFIVFDFGTETAIESVEGVETATDGVIYDLAGRRVQKVQKGMYIMNGRIVIK